MINHGLVLAGGGLRGAYQLGVLAGIFMEDDSYNPIVLAGISTGALTSSFLAQAEYEKGASGLIYRLSELTDIYNSLRGSLGRVRFPGGYIGMARGILFHGSLEDPRVVRNLIEENIDQSRLKNSGREFRCGSVNLNTGEYVSVSQDTSYIKKHIMASATVPGIWPPIKIESDLYIDGGARNMFPLRDAVSALKARTESGSPLNLDVILTTPLDIKPEKIGGRVFTHKVVLRTADILMYQILLGDLNQIIKKNALADAGVEKYRKINLRLFFPDVHYDISLEADPEKMREMYSDGVERRGTFLNVEDLLNTLTGDLLDV